MGNWPCSIFLYFPHSTEHSGFVLLIYLLVGWLFPPLECRLCVERGLTHCSCSFLPILPLTHTIEVGLLYVHTSRFGIKILNSNPQWTIWKYLLDSGQGLSDILHTIDFTRLIAYLHLRGLYLFLLLLNKLTNMTLDAD